MAYSKKLYVIGDKQDGVLFIAINPLRAAFISNGDVQAYSAAHPDKPVNQIQQDMAASIKALILMSGVAPPDESTHIASTVIGASVVQGSTISDAEFCFVAELDNAGWETTRNPFPPLHDVLQHLAVGAAGNPPDQVFEAPITYVGAPPGP